jgi:hypothetical protein
MSCEPKPDVVSSTAYHADTDNDYDVDTDDEGFTKTWPARDEDGRSRKRKKPSLEEEDDHEVRVQHTSIDIDNDQVEKKRDLESRDSNSNKQKKKRQKFDAFTIDLSDVPPQLPISKHADKVKGGALKYAGVYFDKSRKKWSAKISMGGRKQRHIGYYDKEEEAAVDYARAVFKYKGQDALHRARERHLSEIVIDLSGVPPQSPILKPANRIKEGSSKYAGVCFNKAMKKWIARIKIDGKNLHIGYYEDEEEAAADYARALFKYKGTEALAKAKNRNSYGVAAMDLSDVPPQSPIQRPVNRIKEGSSKYAGVCYNKRSKKWVAKIRIDGKMRHIGLYENEEEAAVDYAGALFKYKGTEALAKARVQNSSDPVINLSGVPPQPLIPKIGQQIREGGSKYKGVYFDKSKKKWQASIWIDGKMRHIGYYENEEEAAADYARAAFKYKGL